METNAFAIIGQIVAWALAHECYFGQIFSPCFLGYLLRIEIGLRDYGDMILIAYTKSRSDRGASRPAEATRQKAECGRAKQGNWYYVIAIRRHLDCFAFGSQ